MTDITDQDREVRRIMQQMQGYVNNESFYTGNPREWLRDLREVFPAPALTLAEELRDTARWWRDGAPTWEQCCDRFDALADRAEQMERERNTLEQQRDYWCDSEHQAIMERDEARAEVERLTAERQEETMRRVNEQYKGLPVRDRDWLNKDGTPDPADVPYGEAWLVEWKGRRHTAVRVPERYWWVWRSDVGYPTTAWCSDITLIARLVPAPRVITNTDELAALPHRTVIRDNAGVMFQRIVHGWYQAGDTSVHRSDDNFVCLPAEVLWEPEV